MLEDDIVLKNCYYWASKMVCRGVDFDALVSVGYIVGKPLKDARLLKDWIHFSMLRYIIDEVKHRKKCIDVENSYISNLVAASKEANYSDLYISIEKANLSDRESSVLRLCFFEELSQVDVAKRLNITQQTVNVYVKRASEKIKLNYLRGIRI